MLGVGVMIQSMGGRGNLTEEKIAKFKSLTIKSTELKDNNLLITFEDDSVLTIYDSGQSCCERRYVTTDDDLTSYVGLKLHDFETFDMPTVEDGYGEPHEQRGVRVTMSDGRDITLVTHNEHNGYYGGFWIKVDYEDATVHDSMV